MSNKFERSATIFWAVRWSVEFLANYARGPDGKTQFEMLNGERCKVPLAMCGDKVVHLQLKTATPHSKQLQPRMKEGIWLGAIDGTEESIIGIEKGAAKCRTIRRFPEEQRRGKKQ